jgi:hypothetical protein
MLLQNNGGRERPLLPSLTELAMVDFSSHALSSLPLCEALVNRVKQGVPVKVLDLRMCDPYPDGRPEDWLRSLSEIGVDILDPEKTRAAREQTKCLWKNVLKTVAPDEPEGESSEEEDDSL